PQHLTEPSDRAAQACVYPADTATASVTRGTASALQERSLDSRRFSLTSVPQQRTVPSWISAQLYRRPAEIAVTPERVCASCSSPSLLLLLQAVSDTASSAIDPAPRNHSIPEG